MSEVKFWSITKCVGCGCILDKLNKTLEIIKQYYISILLTPVMSTAIDNQRTKLFEFQAAGRRWRVMWNSPVRSITYN